MGEEAANRQQVWRVLAASEESLGGAAEAHGGARGQQATRVASGQSGERARTPLTAQPS